PSALLPYTTLFRSTRPLRNSELFSISQILSGKNLKFFQYSELLLQFLDFVLSFLNLDIKLVLEFIRGLGRCKELEIVFPEGNTVFQIGNLLTDAVLLFV